MTNHDTNWEKKSNKAYERIMKWAYEPPQFKVIPTDNTDRKTAKIMQELINYQYKNNVDGITTKYFKALKRWWRKEV